MIYEIKSWRDGKILYSAEADSLKDCVEMAVKSCADLSYADLRSADLRSADLRYAVLRSANLRFADLRYANLSSAVLRSANLRSADLSYANLSSADLSSADLRSANLSDTRKDFLAVLFPLKNEVAEFYKHLLDGRIDGSKYEGECACLKGTFANIKKCDYKTLNPDDKSSSEILFLAIKEGDTPETNPVSAIVKEWTLEFMKDHGLIAPVRKVVWE